jgi:hypothetical protein
MSGQQMPLKITFRIPSMPAAEEFGVAQRPHTERAVYIFSLQTRDDALRVRFAKKKTISLRQLADQAVISDISNGHARPPFFEEINKRPAQSV